MDYASGRSAGCRIYQYTHRGLAHLCLENELLRLTVLTDKGADITEILYKPSDINFMWLAPGGGVRETGKIIPTSQSSLGNNLDYYEGGWHEAFPGGGPYIKNGMRQGLHGEACLLPWQFRIIQDHEDEISVRFWCETIRFPARLEKTVCLRKGSAYIDFVESLTNLSGEEQLFMWGHHPVFGPPFLDESCRIDIPASVFMTACGFNSPTSFFNEGDKGTWPSGLGKDGKKCDLSVMPANGTPNAELIYITGLNAGRYTITNTKLNLSFELSWDRALFDCIWYWRVLNGLPGYPWYGRTYSLGLEFWSGYPNFEEAVKNGSIKRLKAHESIDTHYAVNIKKN